MTPLALELLKRYLTGESAEMLATEMGIPVERIQQRLEVAAIYVGTTLDNAPTITPAPAPHYDSPADPPDIEDQLRKRVYDATTRVGKASLNFDAATAAIQSHEVRPDGNYSLRQCSAELKIAHEEYREALRELIGFLKNKAVPR